MQSISSSKSNFRFNNKFLKKSLKMHKNGRNFYWYVWDFFGWEFSWNLNSWHYNQNFQCLWLKFLNFKADSAETRIFGIGYEFRQWLVVELVLPNSVAVIFRSSFFVIVPLIFVNSNMLTPKSINKKQFIYFLATGRFCQLEYADLIQICPSPRLAAYYDRYCVLHNGRTTKKEEREITELHKKTKANRRSWVN